MIERRTGAVAGVYCNHFAFDKAVGRDTTNFDEVVVIARIVFLGLLCRPSPTIKFALPNEFMNVEKDSQHWLIQLS
ncbi:hypothetical protein TNCT_687911 [Trichonephila clavata]|uniref:Uncharacterized protein n=1 Tax=Trichonephila clavata TaxID=2740835 RepID=A0A8X6FVT1_TRICU|nr:hypothetical protein TNCT_687911 [Trichonephila clavata]